MTITAKQPITGSAVWRGQDLARSDAWVRRLSPAALDDIDRAFRSVRGLGRPLLDVTRDDFPLGGFAAQLTGLRRALEDGPGVLLLRGIPVDRYTDDELRLIFWGLGTHLGVAVSQSQKGELLGEVRDLGVRRGRPESRGYRSREHLRFHTDRCDVVALLCVRKAASGGLSRVVSSPAIHNEMLGRRPDLLERLFGTYYHSRQGEEAPGEARFYPNPVFGVCEGLFTSQFSRAYVESAQLFSEVPRITPEQDEALDLLAEVADELCFEFELEPGDIQLLNNHVAYHSRTAYEDAGAPVRRRLLLRLWLAVPGSRRLPEEYKVLWGRIEPGAVRGGVRPQRGWPDAESRWRAIRLLKEVQGASR